MKKILTAAVFFCVLLHTTSAQDENYIRPKAIGVSFFLNDFVTPSRIRSTSLSTVIAKNQLAKFREMNPGLAIHYFKGVTNHIDFNAYIGGSFIKYPMPNKTFYNENFLLEGAAMMDFKLMTEKYWFTPYLVAGIGGHKYRKYYGAFMPLGLGFKFNLFDEAHIFFTSTYRVPVTLETANYHIQHTLGVAGVIKKKPVKIIPPPPPPPPPSDRDGDGIPDSLDKCPDVKGLARYQGCPIPDTDGDGINDEEDKCPTVPGLARYQGCPIPDTDGDGINDEEDKCPTVPGVARYQGCPIPDTDKDGVNDEEDKCPTIPGPKENFGCPIIPDSILKRVEFAAKNILFVTGSAKLQTSSFKGLNDVARILTQNPDMKLAIDGHTDNVGKADYNQKLSEDRAASVKTYLASKGIDAGRMTSAGHGFNMPIADNKTAAGRQKNRRVELKLSYYTKVVSN